MAYHCIIVPFDGSDHAQSALNAACGIAKGHDTQVHVVNVVPINIFPEVAALRYAARSGRAKERRRPIRNFSMTRSLRSMPKW